MQWNRVTPGWQSECGTGKIWKEFVTGDYEGGLVTPDGRAITINPVGYSKTLAGAKRGMEKAIADYHRGVKFAKFGTPVEWPR
jgi:hypothetical protein